MATAIANSFDAELGERIEALRQQGLHRALRRIDSAQSAHIEIAGRQYLNFSSNDYLGLANEPVLKEAAKRAVDVYGAGAGASRLICGSQGAHHELDEAIADFKGAPAALSFSTGYAAAMGVIPALMSKADVIVIDRLAHASIIDAARLSGAKLRVFGHNDLNELEDILRWADSRNATEKRRNLIVTESIFSMDGDEAPLEELVELKERYGAWLMVDEAHATGLYGQHRRGLAEARKVSERIEIQMGTLGKAAGSSGGYICGSKVLIEFLINQARSFIFSTAPTAAAVGAAKMGIECIRGKLGEERCERLWRNVDELLSELKDAAEGVGLRTPAARSAILPLMVGDENKAMNLARSFFEAGIFIPAIRYPTVKRGEARLRLTVSALHTAADLAQFRECLRGLQKQD